MKKIEFVVVQTDDAVTLTGWMSRIHYIKVRTLGKQRCRDVEKNGRYKLKAQQQKKTNTSGEIKCINDIEKKIDEN